MRQNQPKLYSILVMLIVILLGYLAGIYFLAGNEITISFLILLIIITMWPVIVPIIFVIAFTIVAILFFVPRHRGGVARVLILSALFAVAFLLSSARMISIHEAKTDEGFDSIISAIQEYKNKESKLPSEIQDLMPNYLDEDIVNDLESDYDINYYPDVETGEFRLCYTVLASACYLSELGDWKTFPTN